MEFEDYWEEVLICSNCSYSIEQEYYGAEDDDNLYPLEEDLDLE